jgi:plastocyanin
MTTKHVITLLAGVAAGACNGDTTQPRPPSDLLKTSGDAQSWYFNNPLPTPLSVTAVDVSGQPVRGVVVTWAVTGEGGVSPAQSTTNANGVATTIDSIGSSTLQRVSASFPGLPNAATFTEIGSAPPTAVGVSVNNNAFVRPDTAVQIGGTVTWTWNSGTTLHSVTYLTAPGALPTSSPTQDASGPTFSTTFTTVGRYTYHCTQHPTLMVGSVTVVH